MTPVVHLELRISPKNFTKKFEMALILYSEASGETDLWKIPEVENLVALAL